MKKCLDYGYVKLIDYMPHNLINGTCEYRIAQAARISFDNFNLNKSLEEDNALIRYLYENNHTSPLEMVEFMFEIYCPQFVATHLHRHRTANINEQSQRYTELKDEFYHPSTDIRAQSKLNKQGSYYDSVLEEKIYPTMQKIESLIQDELLTKYHSLVDNNVAKELARSYTPRAMYTKMVYKMDANNLLKFFSLRCAPDAQKETRVYANAMKELVRPLIPTLIRCLDERMSSVVFRPNEIVALRTGVIDIDGSKRRKQEFKEKFNKIRRKKLLLLIGYQKTGKDTLAEYLIEGRNISSLYWLHGFVFPSLQNPKRLSLADALKHEIHSLYPDANMDDRFKDEPQDVFQGKSLRQICTLYGHMIRNKEPNRWINKLDKEIKDNQEHDIIITDCRFRDEIVYFKSLKEYEVISVRLFRSSVPIPKLVKEYDVEHQLDEYKTDYLLTDNISSLIQAIEIFPQYLC